MDRTTPFASETTAALAKQIAAGALINGSNNNGGGLGRGLATLNAEEFHSLQIISPLIKFSSSFFSSI